MHFSTASEWLAWIASIHTTEMDLGLDRVKEVARRLDLLKPARPVIIVGGTNGKGSTIAGLDAIYRAAQYQVGKFTSPYLFQPNELVCINGKPASDAEFCAAFEKIDAARGDITLTPFEFHTLAALLIFKNYPLDVLLLEVGLGGRLDAVNMIDADVAVVTSIGIDHVEWLGNTRELIGYEKAGIFRQGKPAVYGDFHPPASLMKQAAKVGAPLFCQGKEFSYHENQNWSWSYKNIHYENLPRNSLAIQNMSIVLMVISLLQDVLPVDHEAIVNGLANVKLAGRIQIMEGPVTKIYDVSHNPAAVAWLAKKLRELPCAGQTYAVFSMLADKDITESIKTIKDEIDHWYAAPLTVRRAATLENLQKSFQGAEIEDVLFFSSIQEAYGSAVRDAKEGDRIVVFGSFHTVADCCYWSVRDH